MTIFLNEKALRLHELISRKQTGTPKQLAAKLGCCQRTALYKLEELRQNGLPIAWDAYRQTYYYTEPVLVNISIILGEKEMKKVIGGNGHASAEDFYYGAKKLHRQGGILDRISRIQNRICLNLDKMASLNLLSPWR